MANIKNKPIPQKIKKPKPEKKEAFQILDLTKCNIEVRNLSDPLPKTNYE